MMYFIALLSVIAQISRGFYYPAGAKRWDASSTYDSFSTLPSLVSKRIHPALFATIEDNVETGPLLSKTKRELLAKFVKKMNGKRVIQRILIANNGMAATKAILSMRQWAYVTLGDERALEFVALATRDDLNANAEFIRLADTFVEVPSGSNKNNYANVDLIVSIAEEQQVDAVWPGWGHASENPKLPTSLKAKGIQFIGPTAPVMFALGDKVSANILAQTAEVPSIPWSGGGIKSGLNSEGVIPQDIFNKACVFTVDQAAETAKKIGYPVMIKASEGGGGKGIRMAKDDEELKTNFVQVQNEVPGSPIFMMQLCTNARHLEVQIVGDEYGNAIALNGRDCSTQRRFQKIFEEGPPSVAPKEVFREMELAAQRLTQSIGYIGAGTVEYLYNAASNKFFFLELNPRLQVEHPVTEGLTGTNLPATQLQVAMGIALDRIPEIRTFFGRSPEGLDKIDFMKDRYIYPKKHVIAARITAENPDEGFKPTSGRIERVKFQSTPRVWGYFSVGANGGIHEFADSQFGHVFASGETREEARQALVMSLKEIDVRGDIRTTVEYLIKLLETPEFKDNTIDTSWLDGIIREKTVSVLLDPDVVALSAATTDNKYINVLEIVSLLQLAKLLPTAADQSICVENVISQAYRSKDALKTVYMQGSESSLLSSPTLPISVSSTLTATVAATSTESYQNYLFELYQIYRLKRIELNQSLQRMLSSPLSAAPSLSSSSSSSSQSPTSDDSDSNTKHYDRTTHMKNSTLTSTIIASTVHPVITNSEADLNRDHVFHLISQFEAYGLDIEPDTIHILISDAFKKRQIEFAEYLFHHFFFDRSIQPNHRSLNIMIENFRLLDNSALAFKYFDFFKTSFPYLQPDTYTLSSLIRMARSPTDIMSTLIRPSLQPVLTAPVMRCAVETLGRLGESPERVVQVAQEWLTHNDSVYVSSRSGDALITALIQSMKVQPLSSPSSTSSSSKKQYTNKYNDDNNKNDDISSSGSARSSGLDMALKLCLPSLFDQKNKPQLSVVYSGKGLTALFTGIQRELRSLCHRRYSLAAVLKEQLRTMNDEDVETSKEKISFQIVTKRIAELRNASQTLELSLLSSFSTASCSSSLVEGEGIGSEVIELNGRLCDAILRTYLEDAEGAREAWLKRLLPAVKRRSTKTSASIRATQDEDTLALESLSSSSTSSLHQRQQQASQSVAILLEAAEKALEAIMFLAGFNNKAEMGLEAARTARSRGFPKFVLMKLGQSYSRGKTEKATILMRSRRSVSSRLNWVEQGLERSIESELGVLLDTNSNKEFPIKNIRFKF